MSSHIFTLTSELAPNTCLEADEDLVQPNHRYGGVMLGPVRFTHIEDCARQVCNQVIIKDEIDDSIATLTNLDSTLAALRVELETLRRRPPSPPPPVLPAASRDSSTTDDAGDFNKLVEESSSTESSLPPWFQNAQPDAHNPRKRSRSPERSSDPTSVSNSKSNGEDDEGQPHASKRSKSTIQQSSDSPTAPSPPKSVAPPAKAHDYFSLLKDLDVKKARRLITARENAIKSVKTLVMREKEKREDGVGPGGGAMKNVVALVEEGG